MMIDTLQAVDTLKEHGFEDEQARAIAAVVTHTNDELATKQDIEVTRKDIEATRKDIELLRGEMQTQNTELRSEFKSDIAELRSEFKSDIAELRAEITGLRADVKVLQRNFNTVRWMIGLLYPLTFGVLIALLF